MKRNWIENLKAKNKFLVFVGATLLMVIVVLITVSAYVYSSILLKETHKKTEQQMSYAVRNIDSDVRALQKLMESIYLGKPLHQYLETDLSGMSYTETNQVVTNIDKYVTSLISPYQYRPELTLYWTPSENSRVYYGESRTVQDSQTVLDEPWYQEAIAFNRHQMIWDCVWEDEQYRISIVLKLGLKEEKEVVARLTQSLSVVCDGARSVLDVERGQMMILDAGGAMLYTAGPDKRLSLADLQWTEGTKPEADWAGVVAAKVRGEDKSVYCQPYDKMNWQILYIVENNSFLENTPYLWLYMILILVTVAFSVAMLLFSSRVMTKRLVQLTKAVRQVDKDHLVLNTEISGNDEVGVLSSFLQETLEMVRQLIRDNQKIEKERYAMELQSLQEQINPHFLYNALSAIAAMAYDIEAYWIRDALLNLADFYRLSLSHGADTIRLQDELHILDSYLAICRLRFDSQLDIRMDIGPETVELYVPKLIIQPFIENAVFHGNAGSIQMSARCVEDHLLIMIQDDGTGMNEEQIRSAIAGNQDGKHALQNIQRRLRLRYGEPYGLSIESQPGQGTTVTLTLPCQRELP